MGISTVYGNASLERTTQNALSVLEAIGRPEIPVFPGARRPFCREVHHAPEIHGESGLDGTDLLPVATRMPQNHLSAILEMRDAIMSCKASTVWIVTTGTLTNAALLFATFPEVADHIKGLSIMGGAIGDGFTAALLGTDFDGENGRKRSRIGNSTGYAEFNIWCDPHSAKHIFRNSTLKAKTFLIPLDVSHQAFATDNIRENLLYGVDGRRIGATRLRRMFHDLLIFFAKTYSDVFGLVEGPPLHDPLAVAILLMNVADIEQQVRFNDNGGERWDVDIELCGEQMGRTVIKSAKEGAMIPRSLDTDQFWKVLDQALTAAEKNGVQS